MFVFQSIGELKAKALAHADCHIIPGDAWKQSSLYCYASDILKWSFKTVSQNYDY